MTFGKSTPTNNNNNAPIKGHKRQASIGLGIVTHLADTSNAISKNNSFFEMTLSDSSTIKPPPPLNYTYITHSTPTTENSTQEKVSLPSFADRIRNIALANRKSALVAPIEKKDNTCCTSPRQFPHEKIIPLPSPSQHGIKQDTPNLLFTKHPLVTPLLRVPTFHPYEKEDFSPPSSAIPILSHSPNFSPSKTNIIPSLIEDPMLGDFDDNTATTATREHKFPSPVVNQEEDYLIDKHIWKFRLKKLLGVGAFSKVFSADDLEKGGKYAVKMINKDHMMEDMRIKSSIEREVGVLKFLNHDRIVQLEATMETEQYLCIVLEYVQGEELFDFVQKMHSDLHKAESQTGVDEKLVRRLALELIDVVYWLHDHNIVHRDLKLENILVYYDDQGEAHLKITDFGLARVVDPREPTLTTRCGSEEYAAPEIVQSMGYDGRLTDTWSIGIILYALLVGYLPFSYNPAKGEKLSHLFHRIVTAQVKWPSEDKISAEAKEAVNRILVRQPDRRITLDQIKTLSWFNM